MSDDFEYSIFEIIEEHDDLRPADDNLDDWIDAIQSQILYDYDVLVKGRAIKMEIAKFLSFEQRATIIRGFRELFKAALYVANDATADYKLLRGIFKDHEIVDYRKAYVVKNLMSDLGFEPALWENKEGLLVIRWLGEVNNVSVYAKDDYTLRFYISGDTEKANMPIEISSRAERGKSYGSSWTGTAYTSVSMRVDPHYRGSNPSFQFSTKSEKGYTNAFLEEVVSNLNSFVSRYIWRNESAVVASLNKKQLDKMVDKLGWGATLDGNTLRVGGTRSNVVNKSYKSAKDGGEEMNVAVAIGGDSKVVNVTSIEQFVELTALLKEMSNVWDEINALMNKE